MDASVIASLGGATIAVVGAVLSARSQVRIANIRAGADRETELRRQGRESDVVLRRYRDPLTAAAHELQSRLYNIVRKDFLCTYLTNGGKREKEYATQHTAYCFAQYLCWREILRQSIQFLDLGEIGRTRDLAHDLAAVEKAMASDEFDSLFCLFRGEQRAVGEVLTTDAGDGPRCIGYAAFVNPGGEAITRWTDPIARDVLRLADRSTQETDRVVALQHALVDVIVRLDPIGQRVPAHLREKL